ncbi:MAG: hypothetical protein ABL958_04920 [Bdellovibrionia bacterium]
MKQRIALFLAFFLISLYGMAAIPPQVVLDTRSIKPVQPVVQPITSSDVALVIPMNLQPGTNDEDTIMKHVMDHSVNSFVRGDYFRNTELGRAAETVEQALKTQVSLGSTVGEDGEPETQHILNFQVMAFEQRAFLTYTGLTNLNLTYTAASANLDITLSQPLGGTTTLVLSHSTSSALSGARVSWAW